MAIEDGYAICFNEWALDKDIKNELGLLLIISGLTAEQGYCYAKNKYLADLFEVSEDSISRKIKKLEDLGYVQVHYEKRGAEITARYITIPRLAKNNQDEAVPRTTKMWDDEPQKCGTTNHKNAGRYNIYNNTIDNNTIPNSGEISKSNNILEKNNQISQPSQPVSHAPRVKAPVIKASAKIPTEIQAKLNEWNNYPETKKALEDYCLFCLDTYNQPKATLKHKINQICKMANNVPKGIEIICEYNITGNYKTVFKPNYYNKVLSESSVVSKAYEGDFVRDEDGNIEEIW